MTLATYLARASVGLALFLCACQAKSPTPREADLPPLRVGRPYYRGTPQVQQEIRAQLAAVPTAGTSGRHAIAGRILAAGEPAVPLLVESLSSLDPKTRTLAAYLLGQLGDPRSLDALAMATRDPDTAVRFEAATAMIRMGDRRGLTTLVHGLTDPDVRLRSRSIQILESETGETFGYRADDSPSERDAAASRWQAWLDRPRKLGE